VKDIKNPIIEEMVKIEPGLGVLFEDAKKFRPAIGRRPKSCLVCA
jgi:hypothetical protein